MKESCDKTSPIAQTSHSKYWRCPLKAKSIFRIFVIVFLLLVLLDYTYLYLTPHYTPKVTPIDLTHLLSQSHFSSEDYALLFEQTGLSQPIIDELHHRPDFSGKLLDFQRHYLAELKVGQAYMPPATFCQLALNSSRCPERAFTLAPFHNGYLFFTDATHSFGWRHGHMGLVVDEIHGFTLEAIRPGSKSCLQLADKWEYYPTFKMLRLKDASLANLQCISDYALEHLNGLPYNILSSKNQPIPKTTHCSLLIWQAFEPFGYDLDPIGGYFVSPLDIMHSPLLETLQIYGLKPNKD